MFGAVLRIPARVAFRLVIPVCDLRVTLVNIGMSMSKVPHIVLFAAFFVLTVLQFDELNGRALRRSLLLTVAFGALVELEEGATRTGSCRMTDVLPDIAGAALAAAIFVGGAMLVGLARRREGTR